MSHYANAIGRADIHIAPLGFEHADKMFRWMTDPAVSENLGLRSAPSMEKTQSWLRHAIEDPNMRGYAIWAGGHHVGNLIFDRIDSYLASARLSIYVGEPGARGKGVGLTAVRLGLAEAFGSLSLHKVWLTVHIHNLPAIRAYLRAGFVMEGILRDEFRLNGRLVAAFYMGILREEFERSQAESA
jgi:[ribosomal protein S5]-alanine N-acetyltransferase